MKFYCRKQGLDRMSPLAGMLPTKWEVVTEDEEVLAVTPTEVLAMYFVGCLEDEFGEDE